MQGSRRDSRCIISGSEWRFSEDEMEMFLIVEGMHHKVKVTNDFPEENHNQV